MLPYISHIHFTINSRQGKIYAYLEYVYYDWERNLLFNPPNYITYMCCNWRVACENSVQEEIAMHF